MSAFGARAQDRGRIGGVVRNGAGSAVAGVLVVATNQTNSRVRQTPSGPDGRYSLRLPAGAYRIVVATPYAAKFDKDKQYGEFAIPRGDALEDVIVEAGKRHERRYSSRREKTRSHSQ